MSTGKLFGTSGIRGIVNQDLTPDFCHQVALAIGTALPAASEVCMATDTRISRDIIKEAVIAGLLSSGINVTDFGILPTPALALLTRELGFATGVMITASHNPPEFNGIKLFTGNSLGYSQSQETTIEQVYFKQKFRQGEKGRLGKAQGVKQEYVSYIRRKLSTPKPDSHLRIVVDPGNGAASKFASDIFAQMGFDVMSINDEPNGLFPGRSPEPKEETLQDTVSFLRKHDADLAICFDGDADRVVFCDKEGFLGFNEPVAFISRLLVKKTGKKKVATTVEAGIAIDLAVKDLGAEVVRGRVGDVAVAYLTKELDAALGVEEVGVYIIPETGYYPDSIFASLFLLSQISDVREIRQFFQGLPRLFFQKAKVSCPNQIKELVMTQVKDKAHLLAVDETSGRINTLDGLRLEFPDAWMLIRASGTEPVIRIIAESSSQTLSNRLLEKGKELVQNLVEANK